MSTFLRLLGVFGMLSVLAVGTGLAVLPEMKKLTVGQYDWVTANQFVDFYSLSQMAPGPNGGTEASIARFTALIGDVTKGDNMSFTWCPDKGVGGGAGHGPRHGARGRLRPHAVHGLVWSRPRRPKPEARHARHMTSTFGRARFRRLPAGHSNRPLSWLA